MSPTQIIIAVPLASAWGYIVYRALKKNSSQATTGSAYAQIPGMPSSLQPFHPPIEPEDSNPSIGLSINTSSRDQPSSSNSATTGEAKYIDASSGEFDTEGRYVGGGKAYDGHVDASKAPKKDGPTDDWNFDGGAIKGQAPMMGGG